MSNHLEDILAEMEKNARTWELPGPNWQDIGAGIGGFFQGSRDANAHHEAGAAFARLKPHLSEEEAARMHAALHPTAQNMAAGNLGLGDRIAGEFRSGRQAAKQRVTDREVTRNMNTLAQHAPAAAAARQPPRSAAQSVGHAVGRAVPYALGAAALGAGGYAAYRGIQNASEQNARNNDYMANARHDLTSAMPSMTVTASYEKFAEEKRADPVRPSGSTLYLGSGQAAIAKSLTDTLGSKLIADPIDAIHAKIKRRYYDEPEWNRNFNEVVQGDPMLARAHSENPNMLTDAFSSVKRFSPSLAKDRLATRNLLKHVVMSGGEMDHSVMKMLAETEKALTQSKQRQP